MMRNARLAAGAALALLAAPVPVAAATVTVSTTLDLSASGLGGSGFVAAFTGFAPGSFTPFTLAVGDTLDFTIDFAGSQSLTLHNPGLVWGYIYVVDGEPANDITGQGTLELLDSAGVPFLTSDLLTSTEGAAHFGQQFTPSAFSGGWPSVLTFYGLRFVGTVQGYADPLLTERLYSRPELVTFSSGPTIVPEPGSWAMMIAGFGLVGGAVRRNRRGAARVVHGRLAAAGVPSAAA